MISLTKIKYVVDNSKNVSIDYGKLNDFVNNLNEKQVKKVLKNINFFDLNSLPKMDKFIFVLIYDSINFCYWSEPKWEINYNNKKYTGAVALFLCFKRAIEEGIPILCPDYLSNLSVNDFLYITRGNRLIPLYNQRIKILKEIGNIIIKKYNSDFSNLFNENKSFNEFANEILNTFIYFKKDSRLFKGKKIEFYKKYQLFLGDVCFISKKYKKNISKLTAYSDYKLPSLLHNDKVLVYSKKLVSKLRKKQNIKKGNTKEVELRANTIYVIELIKEKLKQKGVNLTSVDLDYYIWFLSHNNKLKIRLPHHRTINTDY